MGTTMLTLLGVMLMAAVRFQVASASERHNVRIAKRAPASSNQSARSSNADLWQAERSEPDWHRYPGQ